MSRNRQIWRDSTPLHGPPRNLSVSTRWYLHRRNLKKRNPKLPGMCGFLNTFNKEVLY